MPLDQSPTVGPDDPLDDALEWLGGREGLVLREGNLVGEIGPGDVERWYRRVIEGRVDAGPGGPAGGVTMGHAPPRPDV